MYESEHRYCRNEGVNKASAHLQRTDQLKWLPNSNIALMYMAVSIVWQHLLQQACLCLYTQRALFPPIFGPLTNDKLS